MPLDTETRSALRAQADTLARLHREELPLVLPNAWDVPTARVFSRHPRCRALATTSAGISAALGYHPNGEAIPPMQMLDAVARISRAVDVPLTADLESGYGATPGDVAATIRLAVMAGAVGANLEDVAPDGTLFDTDDAAARVRAAREAADAVDVPMVINARTDVFWRQVGDPDQRFDHAVSRLRSYRQAGADCVFAPGVTDPQLIAALAGTVDAPLNVLAGAGTPPVARLRELGVARLSVGSGPFRAVVTYAQHLASELLDDGLYTSIENSLPYQEMAAVLGTE